jgi:hypothetical protein
MIWIVFYSFLWLFAYTISIVIHFLTAIGGLLLGVHPKNINFQNIFTLRGSGSVDYVVEYSWYHSSFRKSPWLVPYFWVILMLTVAFVQSLIVEDPRWITTSLLVTIIVWIAVYLITKLSEKCISTTSTQEVTQIDPLQKAKDYLDGKKVSTPITLRTQVWYESAKSKVCKRYLN